MAIIIPSTGRAEQCARLVERIYQTARTNPWIRVSVEWADVDDYYAILPQGRTLLTWPENEHDPAGSHVAAINRAAAGLTRHGDDMPKLIIKLDDDHWPLTHGWDQLYLNALDELGGTGVVYGNDQHQRDRLATAPGLSTDIVRELGWYAPPQLGHLYVDNFWTELGRRSGRLAYLADTIITHRHPAALPDISRDATYEAGGMSSVRWAADETVWNEIISNPVTGGGRASAPGPDVRSWPSQMDIWADRVIGLAARKGWKP